MNFEKLKTLPIDKIFNGIKLSFENSEELYESALLLKDHKKYGVAISVLILSVEEIIKSTSLFAFLIFDKQDFMKDLFKSNNLHKERLDLALIFSENFKLKDLQKIESINNINFDTTELLEKVKNEKHSFENWFNKAKTLKNDGLYVDFDNKFKSPSKFTEKDFNKSFEYSKEIREPLFLLLSILVNIDIIEFEEVVNAFKVIIKGKSDSHLGIEPSTQE